MALLPSNTGRAERAKQVLVAYASLEGRVEELGGSGMAATLMTDLLADLMHYAALWQIDFRNCIEVAQMHFNAEEAEENAETPKESPACKRLDALRRIADIPLWGEPITKPTQGDKQQLAEVGEYDLESNCYEPSCDAESGWLRDAVETARAALAGEGGEPDQS